AGGGWGGGGGWGWGGGRWGGGGGGRGGAGSPISIEPPPSRWARDSGDAVEPDPRSAEPVSRLDVDHRRELRERVVEPRLERVVRARPQDAFGDGAGDEHVADPAGAQAGEVAGRVGRTAGTRQLQIQDAALERWRRRVDCDRGAGRERPLDLRQRHRPRIGARQIPSVADRPDERNGEQAHGERR